MWAVLLESYSEPSAPELGPFLRRCISSSESNYELLAPQPQFIHYTSHNWPLLSALFLPSLRILQLLSELTPARSISLGGHSNSIITAGLVWRGALPLRPLLPFLALLAWTCSLRVHCTPAQPIFHSRTTFLVLPVMKMFACEIFNNPSLIPFVSVSLKNALFMSFYASISFPSYHTLPLSL